MKDVRYLILGAVSISLVETNQIFSPTSLPFLPEQPNCPAATIKVQGAGFNVAVWLRGALNQHDARGICSLLLSSAGCDGLQVARAWCIHVKLNPSKNKQLPCEGSKARIWT